MPIILLTFGVIVIIVTSELLLRRPSSSIDTLIVGLIIFAIGFMIRLVGQLELGKNFTYEVVTHKGQTLSTHGLHSVIRHPMYTGLGLITIGLCICFSSMFGLLASIVLLAVLGIYRMEIEEKALIRRFGKKYKDYMRTTKRVIPFIY